jgi:hypothetical protein
MLYERQNSRCLHSECFVEEVHPRLSWINVRNKYKKNLKSTKMLTTWVGNMGLLLHIQKNVALHLSVCFIWVHRKFVRAHIMLGFETCSGRLEVGNTACLVLASTVSVATRKLSKDMKPTIATFTALAAVLYISCGCMMLPHLGYFWNASVAYFLAWFPFELCSGCNIGCCLLRQGARYIFFETEKLNIIVQY